jgi:regulator of RNase E activity RraA
VVIDGACRDVDEIAALDLPVFARSVVPFTARRRLVEDTVGEPIEIDNVTVETGDLVIADGTGVAFVGASRIDEVAEVAEAIATREAQMAKDLASGVSPTQVLGGNYETMLDER